jgi:hypothetical protein
MAPRSRAKAVDTDASMSDAQEHRQEEEMVSSHVDKILFVYGRELVLTGC